MNENDFFKQVQNGACVAGVPFGKLVQVYGLRKTLKMFFARYRYTAQLCVIRELKIISVLQHNYDKIPRKSLTKIFIRMSMRSALVKLCLRGLAKRYNINVSFNI